MAAMASNVTLAGAWGGFSLVASNALRGTVWTMVISLMVYSATFLFSVWFEKWWIAVIAGAVSLVVMFYALGQYLFEWIISRATRNSETVNLQLYGQLEFAPIFGMLLVASGLYFASQYVFARKEMK
jgi:hypothetical protein